MSKPNRRRYKMSEIVTEIHERKPTIDIEMDDGQVFSVPPAELWSDEALNLTSDDPVAAASALLGAKAYGEFVAAGGSAALMFAIIAKEAGVDVGESPAS